MLLSFSILFFFFVVQVIAFLDALLLSEEDTGIEKLIVMCPVNTLLNWLDEWNKWIPPGIRNYRVRCGWVWPVTVKNSDLL